MATVISGLAWAWCLEMLSSQISEDLSSYCITTMKCQTPQQLALSPLSKKTIYF